MTSPELVGRLLGLASVGPSAASIPVVTPITGETAYTLPLSSKDDVDAAFAQARAAQAQWMRRSVHERCRVLLRYHDLLLARRDEAMDLVQWETGKARRDAMEEVLDAAITARHYGRAAAGLLRPQRRRGAIPGAVGVLQVRHPLGVLGVIPAWNYPLTLAVSDALPALAAGNGAVIKPDVQTSLTALWAVALLVEAGIPEGLVRVVLGPGPEIGPLVIDRSDVVMFTGSTAVGRTVASRCGERLIPVSLELGGKNAMIVRADADIDRAAEIAVRACFANAGQLCVSMERIYAHRDVHDRFLDAFAERTRGLVLGARIGWGVDVGSLVSAWHLQRVQEFLTDAVAKGATIVTGGRPRPDLGPFVMEPAILTDVTHEMTLCDAETFGPIVAVRAVDSDDEAVRLANDTDYGLHGVVVTRDAREGRALAQRLRTGTVTINEAHGPAWGSTDAPMGGRGASGLGRRHGDEGLLKYTDVQTIATQRILGFSAPFGMSDERWLRLLADAFLVLKRAGLK